MLALHALAVARLTADAVLTGPPPDGMGAVVLNRWVVPGAGPGATPEAFYVNPADPARLVRMRRTVALLSGGEAALPNSVTQRGRFRTLNAHYFVEATSAGKGALDLIDGRVRLLLDGWEATLPDGVPAAVAEEEMTAPIDLDGFPGMLTCRRAFAGEFARPQAA